ncbi:9543_t:CDS:2 [Cetraspora pellucida]|uniref:9543_t:CDS:1 n=1 Tax=Cetraspora pellucida TaxID=1433469 RepID=A0ACA9LJU8_9GLOM|nr:9543_t:CDS:2 [Cetraspora pellucida]
MVKLLDTNAAISIITKQLADRLGISIEKESKMVVVIATVARECMLGSTAKVNINVNGINIPTYLQVLEFVDDNLLLGTDWFQKAQVIVNFDEQKLEFEYESENLEEVKSYSTNSILVGEVLESESEGRVDNKNVEEKSSAVLDSVNIEAQYKANVEQLFKANKNLFANGSEELR